MAAVAIAPLLALWLGYGYLPIVVLCAVMVFFPISLTTAFGVTHIDPDIRDAARLDGAHRWSLLREIEYPLALPAILTGLRNGVTLSMTGAVVGEFVLGGRGLGGGALELQERVCGGLQLGFGAAGQQRRGDALGLGDLGAQLCVLALVPVPQEGLGDCRDQERPRPPCCSRSP